MGARAKVFFRFGENFFWLGRGGAGTKYSGQCSAGRGRAGRGSLENLLVQGGHGQSFSWGRGRAVRSGAGRDGTGRGVHALNI